MLMRVQEQLAALTLSNVKGISVLSKKQNAICFVLCFSSFCPRRNNIPSLTMIRPRVGVVVVVVIVDVVVRTTFKNWIS